MPFRGLLRYEALYTPTFPQNISIMSQEAELDYNHPCFMKSLLRSTSEELMQKYAFHQLFE